MALTGSPKVGDLVYAQIAADVAANAGASKIYQGVLLRTSPYVLGLIYVSDRDRVTIMGEVALDPSVDTLTSVSFALFGGGGASRVVQGNTPAGPFAVSPAQ
jgi:hypothetical protein